MKKSLKIMFFIVIFIIICICVAIFIMNNKKKNEVEKSNISTDEYSIKINTEIEKVQSNQEVFCVEKCIEYYINYLREGNLDAIRKVLESNYSGINDIKNLREQVIDISNDEQIENYKFIALKMDKKEKDLDRAIYFVEGKSVSNDYMQEKECEFTVVIDRVQNVFAIIPENLEENQRYEYNWDIQPDQENFYNKFEDNVVSDKDIIVKYFEYYKGLAQYDYKQAFELLDEEYREERFNDDVEEYHKYLQDIQIENVSIKQYKTEIEDNVTEYIAKNDNNTYYIFYENEPMNISILLDTYTKDIYQFINEYNNTNEQTKVGMNSEKIIMALNSKDYKYIYKKLDQDFANNNFGSLEGFENYMNQNFNAIYEATYYNSSKENNVYVQPVTLKVKDSDEQKSLNIIMKLEEGTDFVMSFSIK